MEGKEWEMLSIGSDESGKGDFFGGPVVVAVRLDRGALEDLKRWPQYPNIKDSKKCKDDWIRANTPEILRILGAKVAFEELTPADYNDRYRRHGNLNSLFAEMHNSVHSRLEGEEHRIVDAFTDKEKYDQYLSKLRIPRVNIDIMAKRAESCYLSVAVASVIARYLYIRQMAGLRERSGLDIPYGNAYYPPHKSVICAYLSLLDDDGVDRGQLLHPKGVRRFPKKVLDREFVKANFSTLNKIMDRLEEMKGGR